MCREDATTWPLFDSLGAGHIGVRSALCLRRGGDFASAVRCASDSLGALFTDTTGEHQFALFRRRHVAAPESDPFTESDALLEADLPDNRHGLV